MKQELKITNPETYEEDNSYSFDMTAKNILCIDEFSREEPISEMFDGSQAFISHSYYTLIYSIQTREPIMGHEIRALRSTIRECGRDYVEGLRNCIQTMLDGDEYKIQTRLEVSAMCSEYKGDYDNKIHGFECNLSDDLRNIFEQIFDIDNWDFEKSNQVKGFLNQQQ